MVITSRNICCGYLLELPWQGDSIKYPQHMFFGVLNTIFFNISNNPSYLELRICSIQTVVVMIFVVISNVHIKSIDCIPLFLMFHFQTTRHASLYVSVHSPPKSLQTMRCLHWYSLSERHQDVTLSPSFQNLKKYNLLA